MENFGAFSRWLIKQGRAEREDPIGDLGEDYISDGKSRSARGEAPISSLRQLRLSVRQGGGAATEEVLAEALLEFLAGQP